MASPSGKTIRAGRTWVGFFGDDSQLKRVLQRVSAQLSQFGDSVRNMGLKIAALGSALTLPFIKSVHTFGKTGDTLLEMSKRTGIAVESLAELGLVAQLSGTTIEMFERGLRKMQRTLVDAVLGSDEAAKGFDLIKLRAEDLLRLSPEKQFEAIATALATVKDVTAKAAAEQFIFGRAATLLGSMISEFGGGVVGLRKMLVDLGLIMSGDAAIAADKLNDTLIVLFKIINRVQEVIGEALAPVMTNVAELAIRLGASLIFWIQKNQQVVVAVFKLSVAITLLGGALVVLGVSISLTSKLLLVFSTALLSVAGAFKFIASAVVFLFTPLGALIAVLGGVTFALLKFTDFGGQALKWLGERFGDLFESIVGVLGGIRDAFLAGDLVLSVKILWAGLKVVWFTGIDELSKAWSTFKTTMVKVIIDAFHAIQTGVITLGANLHILFSKIWSAIGEGWESLASGVVEVWEAVGLSLAKNWNRLKGLFDSTFDVEAANNALEDLFIIDLDKRQKDRAALSLLSEKKLEAELDKINTKLEKKLAAIGKENLDLNKLVDADFGEDLDVATKELIDARNELNNLITVASVKRLGLGPGGFPESIRSLQESLFDIDDVISLGSEKIINAVGTFSNAQLLGLQGGGVEERIAKATEETAKGVKEVKRAIQLGGATFSGVV